MPYQKYASKVPRAPYMVVTPFVIKFPEFGLGST